MFHNLFRRLISLILRLLYNTRPSLTQALQGPDVTIARNPMPTNVELLRIELGTLFGLNDLNEIQYENEPEPSLGPLFWLGGCEDGFVQGYGIDVDNGTIARTQRLLNTETRSSDPDDLQHIDEYISIFTEAKLKKKGIEHNIGLTHRLPHNLTHETSTPCILLRSNSGEGQALLRHWQANGIPQNLRKVGFATPEDIWRPWCLALVDDEVASVAFTARISDQGAELGLVTIDAYRGKGLGAAATAGWTWFPEFAGKELFYSADVQNESSQRVVERLGLERIGWSLRIY